MIGEKTTLTSKRITLGEEDLVLYTKNIGEEWKLTDIHALGHISPPEWHKMWPKQQLPEMHSPPQGRYPSTKRTRSSESSATDSDDSSSQDNTKKHRKESPKAAQAPSKNQPYKTQDTIMTP